MLDNPCDISGYMEKIEAWNAGFKEGFASFEYALVWIINRNGDKQRVWKKVVPDLPGTPEQPKIIEEGATSKLKAIYEAARERVDKPSDKIPESAEDDEFAGIEFTSGREDKPNKFFIEREGFEKEARIFPDGKENNVRIKRPAIKEPEPPKPSIPFTYAPDKPIISISLTGEAEETGSVTGIHKSAIIRYEDGSKAFIKDDDIIPLNIEYKVSKLFNTLFKDKFDVSVPESCIGNIDDFDQSVRNKLETEGGMAVIYNDFVKDALPLVNCDETRTSKIKDKDMIVSTIFNYIMGNRDFHAGNIMIDSSGKSTIIDTGYSTNNLSHEKIYMSPAFRLFLNRKHHVNVADPSAINNWMYDHADEFKEVFDTFESVGFANMLGSFSDSEIFDDNTYENTKFLPKQQLENIKSNWYAAKEAIDIVGLTSVERRAKLIRQEERTARNIKKLKEIKEELGTEEYGRRMQTGEFQDVLEQKT